MNRILFAALLLSCLALFPRSARAQNAAASGSQNESARLKQFFADDWKYWMAAYPEFATAVGVPGYNDRWTDESPDAVAARYAHVQAALGMLASFDRSALNPEDQLSYDLYHRALSDAAEGYHFGYEANPFASVSQSSWIRPVDQMDGPQENMLQVIALMPTERADDYENIVKRLRGVPAVIDQTIAQMQEGLKQRNTPPKIVMRDVPKQVSDQIVDDPDKSPLLAAFLHFPETVPAADQQRLHDEARAAYRDDFVPAFQKLHDFLVSDYIPHCVDTIAISDLPDGAANYAFNVHWHTTTDLTPQQIHQIGLAEVERIQALMQQVMVQTGFHGTMQDFFHFLESDPQFFFTKPEDLLMTYRDLDKRIDPQLPRIIGTLPRLTYGVQPVPDAIAPSQTSAYYQPGSPQAGRPGWFYVNTYDLPHRPKWEMESLALHESVPGHHLQLSIQAEMQGLPDFRTQIEYTAYVEGWALYCETMGSELGLYTDPYQKFGQLANEMWRAVRLVVDTGIHSEGWTRDQAIQYFHDNTSISEHNATVEVDRYIVWPGQALGYKIGQMEIRRLRTEAEQQLGARFDERAFHDAVLDEGALPMDVLAARIHAWIAAEQAKPAAPATNATN
ncbi:MAG: DUF885 domain-containing protein [Candidatus Acidiferrales bacterium]